MDGRRSRTWQRYSAVGDLLIGIVISITALLGFTLVACGRGGSQPAASRQSSTAEGIMIMPSPSQTLLEQSGETILPTIDPGRRPGPGVTASALSADGSFWYAFDVFDDMGGTPPGSQQSGLYRLKDGLVSHFDVGGTIRVLETGPDGDLYIGAGCGLLRFHNEKIETMVEESCEENREEMRMMLLDISFGADGDLWVGDAFCLAHYDGKTWQQYDVPANRIGTSADGTIWTLGWDGRAGSQCCVTHLSGSEVMTYTWSADIPAEANILSRLFEPR